MKLQQPILLMMVVGLSLAVMTGSSKRQSVPLTVQATVSGITYCRNDNELYSARIEVRFTYQNNTNSDILVTKIPQIVADRIAATASDLKRGRLERDFAVHRMVASPPVESSPITQPALGEGDSGYRVIPAHSSYSTSDVIHPILIRSDPSQEIPLSITSGDHVLQLDLSNHLDKASVPRELWSSMLSSRFDTLKTTPLPLNVKAAKDLKSCFE